MLSFLSSFGEIELAFRFSISKVASLHGKNKICKILRIILNHYLFENQLNSRHSLSCMRLLCKIFHRLVVETSNS